MITRVLNRKKLTQDLYGDFLAPLDMEADLVEQVSQSNLIPNQSSKLRSNTGHKTRRNPLKRIEMSIAKEYFPVHIWKNLHIMNSGAHTWHLWD